MLIPSPLCREQDGPVTLPSPRLGSARLKAVETVAALVRVGNANADLAVAESGLILRCLELFVLFPFNNLLHHQVLPDTRLLICTFFHLQGSGFLNLLQGGWM